MQKNAKMLIGLVVLIIIAGGAYAIFHKSSNGTTNSGYNTPPTTPTNGTQSSGAVVQTKTDSSLGQYLATANGLPLYTYKLDSTNTSNCTGSCLSNWPAYVATSSTTSLPANVATFTRADDHTVQYTYKGLPLYTFTGDSAGHVTGDGLENFQIAKP